MREDHSTWYDASTESFPSRAAVGARLRAAVARRRLVYGVIGYSITVGRGNYFNQSWPAALERRLARALPGVAIEVRNMAVGASPPYPTCACLAETVGADVDVVDPPPPEQDKRTIWKIKKNRRRRKGKIY